MKKIFFFLIWIFLIQCAPQAKFLNKKMDPPSRVAILPVVNMTVDVDGALLFREIFYKKLKKKGLFKVQRLEMTDSVLNEMGITDGGQLSAIDEIELFDSLKVDGLLYIVLLKCDYQTLGIFEKREVKANIRLKTTSGLYWEDERNVKRSESKIDKIFEDADDVTDVLGNWIGELGSELTEKTLRAALLKHPLRLEMNILANKMIKTLRIE